MKLPTDVQRKFDIIGALARLEKPGLTELHQATSIPKTTIKRQIASLRSDFGLRILYVRDPGHGRGATGYYVLEDWGVISEPGFWKHYAKYARPGEIPRIRGKME